MKRLIPFALTAFAASVASAADPASLHVSLKGVDGRGVIEPTYAFCQASAVGHTQDGNDVSPEISWSAGPKGTKSYVIIMHDPDVPQDFSNANKVGQVLAEDMPRQEFIHWVLVDIAPNVMHLPAGADSDHIEQRGKQNQQTQYGIRGLNDYSKFKGGKFFGYDGPCPPWNDARWHHYTFTVFALDMKSLGLHGAFGAAEARNAMGGHVLAQGAAVGLYSQNPALLKAGPGKQK